MRHKHFPNGKLQNALQVFDISTKINTIFSLESVLYREPLSHSEQVIRLGKKLEGELFDAVHLLAKKTCLRLLKAFVLVIYLVGIGLATLFDIVHSFGGVPR